MKGKSAVDIIDKTRNSPFHGLSQWSRVIKHRSDQFMMKLQFMSVWVYKSLDLLRHLMPTCIFNAHVDLSTVWIFHNKRWA